MRLAATTAPRVLRTYVLLMLLSTFAASFIWGINTLFLLDAGLTVTQAFAANAFFTVGQVLFEVPTGVVADTLGRRTSYLLGTATLFVSTFLYLWMWRVHGPFWAWAAISVLLGLGFTFFSGATEAWLVDALKSTGYEGTLEAAFARGQMAGGTAMLIGTVAGGAIAQATSLGVPYILRIVMLGLTFLVAFAAMHDIGFTPRPRTSVAKEMRSVLKASFDYGFRNPPVRWLMLAAPFAGGVGIYAFYAMQPYLLELYGKKGSYAIAGLAAAIVAGTQILGGYLVPRVAPFFRRRTTLLLAGAVVSAASLALIGWSSRFGIALALLSVWALVFAAVIPVRQGYLNGLIPSEQRATILSTDNLLSSSGGVAIQPALGKVADVSGYAVSYVVGGAVELLALPFLLLARRERAASDEI
ncbi:MAG TPA: MFS transporter [Thermoanaerobaculia bacterium]|jgi:MFS family permease